MKRILSVCIASYNKSETTSGLVRSILTCKNPDLEVVVVDNASTDDTVERLMTISDVRLKIKKQDNNIGAAPNILASILEGEGTFCLYTNDRDIIYPEKLDKFINYLKCNPSIGGGHCVRNVLKFDTDDIKYQGINALLNLNFRDEHPTGYFFRKEILKKIPKESLDKYAKPETGFASFVWENLLCEIICQGYVVVQYNDVIWKSTGNTSSAKYHSGYAKMDDLSDRWFYPGNCLRRAVSNTEDTLRLCRENSITLSEDERYKLYAGLLGYEYRYAVFRYKNIFETPNLAYHYKVPHRKVTKKELNECRDEILGGYISFIRTIEAGCNGKEKYIYDKIDGVEKDHKMTLRCWLGKYKRAIVNKLKNND